MSTACICLHRRFQGVDASHQPMDLAVDDDHAHASADGTDGADDGVEAAVARGRPPRRRCRSGDVMAVRFQAALKSAARRARKHAAATRTSDQDRCRDLVEKSGTAGESAIVLDELRRQTPGRGCRPPDRSKGTALPVPPPGASYDRRCGPRARRGGCRSASPPRFPGLRGFSRGGLVGARPTSAVCCQRATNVLTQGEIGCEGLAAKERGRPVRTRPRSFPQPSSTHLIGHCPRSSGAHVQDSRLRL